MLRNGKIKVETFGSVWDAVSDTPEQTGSMRIRAELVVIIDNWIEQQGFSQAQVVSALGVTQPRVSELTRGEIQVFSIDKLITMMTHAGLHTQRIEVQYPHAA